jgi:hypothetical protein
MVAGVATRRHANVARPALTAPASWEHDVPTLREHIVKAYSVRQLKSNPSEALREARKHPVVVLNRDEPEALIVHLDDEALLSDAGVREALATALYRDGSISLGKGARVARMPVADFMRHASRLGIAVIRGSAADALSDADAIRTWQTDSS